MQYHAVINHGNTRWLSLFPAVEWLLQLWPAIKSYFLELGEEQTDDMIWNFIGDQADEATGDTTEKISVPECYLYFVHHYMQLFHETISLLERKHSVSPHLHTFMCSLREKLVNRVDNRFFGAKVLSGLKHLPESQRASFTTDALQMYNRAIAYLDKWYDFENSQLKEFTAFDLDRESDELTVDHVSKVASNLGIEVDVDGLFDELCLVKKFVPEVRTSDLPLDEKWVQLLKSIRSRILVKVVSAVFAIPVSSAFVERVFSLMGNVWTDNRNHMLSSLVKAELCVKLNFGLNCADFLKYVKEEQRLLKACVSNEKYKF
ncbi:uncharacterized protein LOC133364431 isoform X1 [Rhineura floridana]|uniref:uncharacterized protein LOC133364431 isoform X1 n=1 Tax=Rhineura floridana TaxID=261503 RepID=UPI002AC7E8E0|nr:uncharacterized protein LOC133364431 isoform X1 [Rhineura floridana]XP_061441052.1 uncharacterized protein LOC133364431 isoform X1 [Rhineura floridana]